MPSLVCNGYGHLNCSTSRAPTTINESVMNEAFDSLMKYIQWLQKYLYIQQLYKSSCSEVIPKFDVNMFVRTAPGLTELIRMLYLNLVNM